MKVHLARASVITLHSGDEGNDAADKRANWAQNGGLEHEQDMTRMMDYIREYGQKKWVDRLGAGRQQRGGGGLGLGRVT